jgi:hypothetical protein
MIASEVNLSGAAEVILSSTGAKISDRRTPGEEVVIVVKRDAKPPVDLTICPRQATVDLASRTSPFQRRPKT